MHIPVLAEELLQGLQIKPGEVVVDCTINGGGHAAKVGEAIGAEGTLVGIDLDANALSTAQERLKDLPCRLILVEDNFRHIAKVLAANHLISADKIYFDLGMSSNQLEESNRGFTFKQDEPLRMTFSVLGDVSAEDIVNGESEEKLVDILFRFGEERYARRIAKALTVMRKRRRITTTGELVKIIEAALPQASLGRRIHPATKTFQALRIAVNRELENLEEGLAEAITLLRPKGRIGVISFHRLEDRIVKGLFRKAKEDGRGVILTKKPIVPTQIEIRQNSRARSAKIRFFEKN